MADQHFIQTVWTQKQLWAWRFGFSVPIDSPSEELSHKWDLGYAVAFVVCAVLNLFGHNEAFIRFGAAALFIGFAALFAARWWYRRRFL